GNEYTFEKNDKYVNADEAKDKADTVVFKFIQDTQAAMLSYQNGDIDAVKLQGEQVDQYSSQEGFTNRLQGYLWYLSINFNNPVFQNANLRTALSYAVDREAIAKDVLKDGSVAARGFVPSEFTTGPDGKDYVDTADTLTEYNPDKAAEYYKKAVAELGGDVSFTLLFEDTEASKSVAENLQAQLQKNCPGLTVTLDQKPKKTRLQLMISHDYDIGLTRWGPDYADPQSFMDLVTTTSTYNQGSYSNPAYDALIAKAETGEDAANAEARWKDFQEAEKILVQQDHGVIPIYQNGGAMMINPKVSGIRFHSGGVDDYRWMVVSQ
ncbi:MAG: peptide ABC transporter substrate-binding protein, partial [Solobacterium sp.]|nr:peptide ABC transporter substrate-binding protein [Solobacterium sp.]